VQGAGNAIETKIPMGKVSLVQLRDFDEPIRRENERS
jgi:hypothetical protein